MGGGGFGRWEDKFQEQRGSQAACCGSRVASHGLLPVVSPRLGHFRLKTNVAVSGFF